MPASSAAAQQLNSQSLERPVLPTKDLLEQALLKNTYLQTRPSTAAAPAEP